MIETKQKLLYVNFRLENLDLQKENQVQLCFGWKAEKSFANPNRGGGTVVEYSRDTEMKNYDQVKNLELQYERLSTELSDNKIQRINGKMKNMGVFNGILRLLLILFSIFALLLGIVGGATPFIIIGVICVSLVVLLFVLSIRKKNAVSLKYDELDSLKMKAKSLL